METASTGDVAPIPGALRKWLWPFLIVCTSALLLGFIHKLTGMHGVSVLLKWNVKSKLLISALTVYALIMVHHHLHKGNGDMWVAHVGRHLLFVLPASIP
jgi:hypothetical protein